MVFPRSLSTSERGWTAGYPGRSEFAGRRRKMIVSLSTVILALLLLTLAALSLYAPNPEEQRSGSQISTASATWSTMSPSPLSSSTTQMSSSSATTTTESFLTFSTEFSGERALLDLLRQTDLGPRPPGSRAHELTVDYIETTLRDLGLEVEKQEFNFTDHEGTSFKMTNIIGITGWRGGRLVIIGAHFDTRPRADRETDPAKSEQPILGANDGASGVAVLLELARVFRHENLLAEVRLVFYDGEDYGLTLEAGVRSTISRRCSVHHRRRPRALHRKGVAGYGCDRLRLSVLAYAAGYA